MPPSLAGSQMFREAMSEQLSVRDGAGYDKVFPSGHEPKEGFSWLSEREMSAQSSDEELESYKGEDEGVMSNEEDEGEGRESDGDNNDGDEEALDSTPGALGDDYPFILPKIWTVNDFLLTMSDKVFKSLRDHYQILDDIQIRLPRKFEKCYFGKTANVGMYDAKFATGLRLPLTTLHC